MSTHLTTVNASFTFQWLDYVILAVLLLIFMSIGVYFRYFSARSPSSTHLPPKSRHPTNTRQHAAYRQKAANDVEFLGSRQMSAYSVSCSVFVTAMSAISLLGTTAEVYRFGIRYFLMVITYAVAFPITAELYLPVFYRLNLTSVFEYLEMRFSGCVRRLVAILYLLQMFIYTSIVLYAPALALSQVTGLSIIASILTSGIVCIFYSAMGGLRAVIWTDLVQFFVIFVGLVSTVCVVLTQLGGITEVWRINLRSGRINIFTDFDLDPLRRHTFWTIAIGGSGFVLNMFATNQVQVQRYMACRTMQAARKAIWLNLPINTIFLVCQVTAGLVIFAYYAHCDPLSTGAIAKSDQLFPKLVVDVFSSYAGLPGLFLSCIFSAALSTMSSSINSMSAVILEDLLVPFEFACCSCCCRDRARLSASDERTTVEESKLDTATCKEIQLNLRADTSEHNANESSGDVQDELRRTAQSPHVNVGCHACNYLPQITASVIGALLIAAGILMSRMHNSTVLRMAFSVIGVIGGSIFALFTAGLALRCVNKYGALYGLLVSLLTLGCIGFGSVLIPASPYYAAAYSEVLPVSTANCSNSNLNSSFSLSSSLSASLHHNNNYSLSSFSYSSATTNNLSSENNNGKRLSISDYFLRISYMYYTVLACIIMFCVALPVSLATGSNKVPPPSNLLFRFKK